MEFKDLNLNKPLLNALSDLGITTPTTIQEKAFSVILSGKDVIGLAQTGTGKTFAYLLPLLRLHKFSTDKFPKIAVLVPTRELVVQVVEEVEKLTKYLSFKVLGVYGGANINTQIINVSKGVDLLVATPGRFYDIAVSGAIKPKLIQKIVIDEVDEMLNLGFRTQLINILDLLPEKKQSLLFSASMIPEVENFIEKYFLNPVKLEAAPNGTPLEKITQEGYYLPNFNSKYNLLKYLLQTNPAMNKVLVFTASKKMADLLHDKICQDFPEVFGIIHSNKSQNYRFNSIRRFSDSSFRGLIATDLVSRGLDISDVSHVINFDLPDEETSYIHRIGRTGRADKIGNAITFISPIEDKMKISIESFMNVKIPILTLPSDDLISEILIDAEKPVLAGVDIEPPVRIKLPPKGAFHEKKAKNKKVNLGGSYHRKLKEKYKKPLTRGGKKK